MPLDSYAELSNKNVWDAQTGERLGRVKDLDPDLSSGANSVTYQEFCGDFPNRPGFGQTAQQYYDRGANAEEQAILDPNGDGRACTAEDTGAGEADNGADGGEGEESAQDNPCAGAVASENLREELGVGEGPLQFHLGFVPDVGGCAYLPYSPQGPPVSVFNATAFDPDTGEELGIVKDLDPDLTSGSNSTTYQEFCGYFPAPEALPNGATTAQQYYDRLANVKERAILDPDDDGLACTSDDEAFLSGDTGANDETGNQFEQTWTGPITQTGADGTVTSEFGVEADVVPVSDMTEGLVGEVVGEVSYPSLTCSGVWVLEEANEDSIQVEERIEEGVGNCVEFVPITLTPQEGGSLGYYSRDIYGNVGEGVLTRQGSSAPGGDIADGDVSGNGEIGGGDGGGRLGGGGDGAATDGASDTTTDIPYETDDAVGYFRVVVADTVGGLSQGRLPDTGGGWAVLLFAGATLAGGGWFLVRRFSR